MMGTFIIVHVVLSPVKIAINTLNQLSAGFEM